ncbi:uncharacterized protein F5891DRAFT_979151 [Suillus fuscotomentosus]|uniref:Uncharacterized protein n=1 Tax=Suillus fuscotomentosus TaxID=1912939 RepID=A0AAD4EBT1_9AGAM|nr:uncharacterized protein F5891DRAFT_979151 [Suillus fuscotomentosus]KAG1902043.1 hypothetical protein F5891DRAFT_979151 [Suillus fuscotomentosus]
MSPVFLSSSSSIISTPFSLSLHVIPPALLLILSRNKLVLNILLALNTVLPAIASGLGLGASFNHVHLLQRLWNVFLALHACLLSLSSLYVLFVATTPDSLVPHRAFRFLAVLVTTFLICVLNAIIATIAGSIASTPTLLSPTFSLISRSLQLPLAIGIFLDIRSAIAVAAPFTKISEKVPAGPESSARPTIAQNKSRRVSSPTPDTWPFPASLVHTQPTCDRSSAKSAKTVVNLPPSLTLTHSGQENSVIPEGKAAISWLYKEMRLPVTMLAAQAAAINSPSWAALQAPDSVTTSQPSQNSDVTVAAGLVIAHSVCSLFWAMGVVTTLYLLPSIVKSTLPTLPTSVNHTADSSVPKAMEFPNHRIAKHSLSRGMSSDSASDFLSMRDPFASPPPPPPPTIGLGIADLNHVQFRDVAAQYRFPAPKAKKAKGRCKRRMGLRVRALEHQASAQALLPSRPPPVHINEGERGLGDEVLMAQLLLQSLTAGTEAEAEYSSSTRAAATNHVLPFPEPTVQVERLGSRWSTSTTALSASTGTVWSEKRSRASTSTSASVRAGGRKSSDARKSSATGFSASSAPST